MTLFRYLDINRFSNLKFKKCIFVGYSEDVKGYRLLQPHSHDIIIRRDVKFDENLLAWEPNLEFVPSMSYEPNSTLVPSSIPMCNNTRSGYTTYSGCLFNGHDIVLSEQ